MDGGKYFEYFEKGNYLTFGGQEDWRGKHSSYENLIRHMSNVTKICRPLCSGKVDREPTGSPSTPSERFVLLSHEN